MKSDAKKNGFTNGFTLIELLVSIAIISILTGVTIIGLSSIRQKAQDTSHLAGIRDLQISMEAYKSVYGKYPTGFTDSDATKSLVPSFIAKTPTASTQDATHGYQYVVSTDKKTYCVYLKDVIFKATTQTDMYSSACPGSWVACRGSNIPALNTACPI